MTEISQLNAVTHATVIQRSEMLTNAASKLKTDQGYDKAKETAKNFESVFLGQLFNMMFSGIKTDGFFGGGTGEKMWRGFLVDHIADAYAERGGIGIANTVLSQIINMSEHAE